MRILKKQILNNIAKQITEAKERLLFASSNDKKLLFTKYNITEKGYREETVEEMRDKYGRNEITAQKGDSLLKKFVESFVNPFTIVLLLLAIISFFTDILYAAPGEKDPTAVIIVLLMVMISGALRFIQEARSDKAAEKLGEMVQNTILIQRDPEGSFEISMDEIVVGDIVYLAAGDMVPADVRILQAKDLFVSQSSLTGESEPVEKFSHVKPANNNNPLELDNLAFMGTNVISGTAMAIVIAVGDSTIFGSIAKQISGAKIITSFEKGVNSVSWVLIRFMMIMVPVVFFINGFTKGDWMGAFLFALSIAVGLTPEMLPMIVSANLAKGAVAMSKKKVIVKDLNSIQNFGAIDILCTDKTGTITQDKVILEHSLDIRGGEDGRILRHGFLNSYFQTGLKNLMDIAIINHANEKALQDLTVKYHKVDEIPFDFNRRRMSVVVADDNGKTQLITKGAVEEMLSVSTHAEYKGNVQPLTEALKKEILDVVNKYNENGFRVLGLSQKTNPAPVGAFSIEDESGMVLIGYLAFLDPPKESTEGAIKALNKHGVGVKILTGDNDGVTRYICKQVGLRVDNLLLGSDVEVMGEERLKEAVEITNVFAKLSPAQKSRIVAALRENGHTVGFMGDGINDAPAMKEADVGISVDTAVDIAKESANIILLEKDLMILEEGIIEGRKTYANIIKYIKMTASSNFGNMFSILAASAFLPFMPMLPIQILVLNLIYDVSCIAIPWDNVDKDFLMIPRKWDASSISKFMIYIGPTSSIFDISTYLLMFFVICPAVLGGGYRTLSDSGKEAFVALFHAGWFLESLWTQTLVIHLIRTPKVPFIQSRASTKLTVLTSLGILVGTVIPYTGLGEVLGMSPLPAIFYPYLIATICLYMVVVTLAKNIYIRKYKELL